MATTHVNEGRLDALRTRVRFPAPPPAKPRQCRGFFFDLSPGPSHGFGRPWADSSTAQNSHTATRWATGSSTTLTYRPRLWPRLAPGTAIPNKRSNFGCRWGSSRQATRVRSGTLFSRWFGRRCGPRSSAPDEILSGIEATLTKDTYVDDPVVAPLRRQRLVRR